MYSKIFIGLATGAPEQECQPKAMLLTDLVDGFVLRAGAEVRRLQRILHRSQATESLSPEMSIFAVWLATRQYWMYGPKYKKCDFIFVTSYLDALR